MLKYYSSPQIPEPAECDEGEPLGRHRGDQQLRHLCHPGGSQNIRYGTTSSVLGIRDLLVRIRIRGSVPLTNGSGSSSGSDSFPVLRIRDPGLFDPGIRNRFFPDPGSRIPDPGSQTHTFQSLVTIFWAKSSIIL
jgi:hypothetical protein